MMRLLWSVAGLETAVIVTVAVAVQPPVPVTVTNKVAVAVAEILCVLLAPLTALLLLNPHE